MKSKRLIFKIFILFILLFYTDTTTIAQDTSTQNFTISVGGSIGFWTYGFDINLSYTQSSGFSLGFYSATLTPLHEDVAGLAVHYHIINTSLFSIGYQLNSPNRLFGVSGYLSGGIETTLINDEINNKTYNIHRTYTTSDALPEYGILFIIYWYPLNNIGLRGSLYLSLVNIKKSIAGLGLSMLVSH